MHAREAERVREECEHVAGGVKREIRAARGTVVMTQKYVSNSTRDTRGAGSNRYSRTPGKCPVGRVPTKYARPAVSFKD